MDYGGYGLCRVWTTEVRRLSLWWHHWRFSYCVITLGLLLTATCLLFTSVNHSLEGVCQSVLNTSNTTYYANVKKSLLSLFLILASPWPFFGHHRPFLGHPQHGYILSLTIHVHKQTLCKWQTERIIQQWNEYDMYINRHYVNDRQRGSYNNEMNTTCT